MSSTGSEALVLAERARDLVQARPLQAQALAEEALELARARQDGEAVVAALHALGFARYRLGDPAALRTFRAAVRAGERNGYESRAAMARRNLAFLLAYAGKTKLALREIEAAREALSGIERARSEVFRIAVYGIAGQAETAIAGSGEAVRVLRRARDTIWEARLLYNRGAALAEIGDARGARRDLGRACRLYQALGQADAVASAGIELGRLRLLEGDPLASLVELDAIESDGLAPWTAGWLFLNRAQAHVALRLLDEARADL